jgi:diguanylate cyclase (GGDEF)-like protein
MPNSPDRPNRPQIRLREGSPQWLKDHSHELLQQKKLLDNTTAFHATFTLPSESDTINFTFINPTLKQEINTKENHEPVSQYLINKLRNIVITHDWEKESTITFDTSTDSPEFSLSNVYGFTIERIEDNQYHLTGRNITDKEAIRKQKEYEIIHDSLTDLFNRRFLNEQLESLGKSSEIDGATIIMLDIDNFKIVNDTRGHFIGDEMLIQLASILKKNIHTTDIAARYGGDEMVIIFPNLTDIKNVQQLIYRLYNTLKEENLSVSFGFATAKKDESKNPIDLNKTLKEADLDLIEKKKYKTKIEQ